MREELFRSKAVAHATRRLDGEVILVTPIKTSMLGGLLALVLAIALAFAWNAEYARKETVSGWLVPDGGAVRATAVQRGVVTELFVAVGDEVKEGQKIAHIQSAVDVDSGNLGIAIQSALEAQLSAAEQRFDATDQRLASEEARLRRQIASTEEELSKLDNEQSALGDRLSLARENADWALENFEEGLTTRADVETWKSDVLDLEQQALSFERQETQLRSRVADIEEQLATIPSERATALVDLNTSKATLEERIQRSDAEAGYFVTSTVDGTIDIIAVKLGQSVVSGDSIAALSPSGSKLIAELYVPSRAAGFIEEGQAVRLKYDAFPFQRYGAGEATITEISQTVLSPREISFAGSSVQSASFRVRVDLSENQLVAYGRPVQLRSGMSLSADIIFDKRSLIEWLLDPIFAQRGV